ncbi:MAG: S8 family serine peptidase [bacterium]|nr:S8 family serine peptidase [bacterium]MCP5067322.1 S8 family serine peptidase [bacterium]
MRLAHLLLSLLLFAAPAIDAADTSKTRSKQLRAPSRKTTTLAPEATRPAGGGSYEKAPGTDAEDPPEAEDTPPPQTGFPDDSYYYDPSWTPGYYPAPEPTTERVDQTGGSLLRGAAPVAPQARPSEARDEPSLHEPGQVIVIHQAMSEALVFANAEQEHYRVRLREKLDAAGLVLTVLQARGEVTAPEAREDLSSRHSGLRIALNHRYSLSASSKRYGSRMVGWGESDSSCGKGLRLGVLDTLVDAEHEALGGASLVVHSVLPPGAKPAPANHGTAIAALYAGRSDSEFHGLLPASTVLVAGAFRERSDGEVDATTDRLLVGIDWLLGQGANVVGLSFVGPPNPVFASVLDAADRRGVGLVAAVGNQGPDASPGFPSVLRNVVAVTAVDVDSRVFRRANRGPGIDLAAPGVDVWVPRPGRRGHYVSGTSFAVPFVASALARASDGRSPAEAREWLFSHARDLGEGGPDETFGHGLLQLGADVSCN